MRLNERGFRAFLLLALFNLGGFALLPIFLLVWGESARHFIMRSLWRFYVVLLNFSRLIHIERGTLGKYRGTILACNHPSLLDVVMICAYVPRTLFIAKKSLRNNPFCAASVRALSLPADADLFEEASPKLAEGWNVLIFPEGTRSPNDVDLQPFKRGCAQLALRTGAPIVCIGETLSPRILGKGQSVWDMGERCITATFRTDAPTTAILKPNESLHAAAIRVTDELRERIQRLR